MRLTHIVIAGAGYGGLSAALNLTKSGLPLHIAVLDRSEQHLLQTRLPQVAGNTLDPHRAALPLAALLDGRGIEYRQAVVHGFDLAQQRVLTDRGAFPYDLLVVALGSEPEDYHIPGLPRNALQLKTLGDAQRISAHIQRALAGASHERRVRQRQALTTFVIGGGGLSGVELAAELAYALPRWAPSFGLDPSQARLILVEAQERLLPFGPEWMGHYALQALTRMGIEVRLGQPIVEAAAAAVRLSNGEEIRTQTLIWTGGVRAARLEVDLPLDSRGRILVDAHLRSIPHPEVFAIGDIASMADPHSGRPLEPSAQLAVQQGAAVARNIANLFRGRALHPYRPRQAGELISLGPSDGVGRLGPLRLYGRPARWAKAINEARYLWSLGAGEQILQWGTPSIWTPLDESLPPEA